MYFYRKKDVKMVQAPDQKRTLHLINGRLIEVEKDPPGINYDVYWIPRKFRENSKLHELMIRCNPIIFQRHRTIYNYYETMLTVREYISNKNLLDGGFDGIVNSCPELEEALGPKRFHISHMRTLILRQMEPYF